jgi:two-component system, LytTR family, sensor kinase
MSRRLARGLLIVAVFSLLAGLSITGSYLAAHGLASPPSAAKLDLLFWSSFRYYLAWVMVTPGILWLSRRVPLTGRRWQRALVFHLLVPVLGSAPFYALTLVLGAVFGRGVPSVDFLAAFWWRILIMEIVAVAPVYWLVLGAATALQLYRDREANQLQAIELQRSLTSAQLDAMRMKLHPHFLFNTLNAVASLARAGEMDGVGRVVEHLGTLLRLSMETSGRQLVTLEEELALVDEHLAIEEIRFKDRLHVIRRIDPASRQALVPNLILQPLVENAIVHGLSQRLDASLLEISARQDGPDLRVAVRDDGPGLPPGWRLATGGRAGLKNVIERLRALYGGGFRFDVENSATGGTIAELTLPFESVQTERVGTPNGAQGRPFDTLSQAEAAAGSREHGAHQDDHR